MSLRCNRNCRELLDTEGAFMIGGKSRDGGQGIALSKPQLPAMSMPVQTLLSQAGLAEQSAVENPISKIQRFSAIS